jgi:hypothetical protein
MTTLGAAILHQILSETWGYKSGNNPQNSAGGMCLSLPDREVV